MGCAEVKARADGRAKRRRDVAAVQIARTSVLHTFDVAVGLVIWRSIAAAVAHVESQTVRANIHVRIETLTLEQNLTLTLRTLSCNIISTQVFSTSVDIRRFAPL